MLKWQCNKKIIDYTFKHSLLPSALNVQFMEISYPLIGCVREDFFMANVRQRLFEQKKV